ncbi:MAG: efflux RND transporter periplasmic adaptor subunit [Chloroflexota bacterium]|nr:efflux RND transporter periplasmic adaptor subunit [Chloroflexota bacterium]
MKKKWLWILLAVVIVAALTGWWWLRKEKASQSTNEILREAEIIRDDLQITVAASGNIAANQKGELRFELPGTVTAVNVEVGDRVATGYALAELESTSLERAYRDAKQRLARAQTENERQLKEAQLNLGSAKLRLEQAKLRVPSLGSASAAIHSAKANLERVQQGATAEDITIAERQLEQAKNALWGQQSQRDATCGAVDFGGASKSQCHAAEAAVNQAEESVRIAELQLQKINAGPSEQDLTGAQAQLDQAYAEYSRSSSESEAQEQGLEIFTADIERAQLTLERLQDGIDPSLEIALERAADELAKATLTAPFEGIVAAINLQTGVQVASALPAVTLVDDTVFFVDVTVDEIEIGKLTSGQAVEITVDAYPKVILQGKIETIAPAPTNSGGIVSYPVRIRLLPLPTEQEVQIRDGMTASVLILTSKMEGALLIPNWAIRTDAQTKEAYTYRLVAGIPERVVIQTGVRNEEYTELLFGLAAGDQIALVTEERGLLFEMGDGPPHRGQ